jgi:hypothetical protein
LFRSNRHEPEPLEALYDLSAPTLSSLLNEVLKGPFTGATSAALAIVKKMTDPTWMPVIESLFNRVDPNGDAPEPHLWIKCAKILLAQRQPSDVEEKLLGIRSHVLGEAALIALEHVPEIAIGLIRKALRSQIPVNRMKASAILAIIDQPWSRSELLAVLSDSRDQEMTAECRSALVETHSDECHQRVLEWERTNPHEPEQGKWQTVGEIFLRHTDSMIRWEMGKLHDRVMPLRAKFPIAPSG